jgi:hypothetical protein
MTGSQVPFRPPALREDVLVSACFGDLPADAAGFDAVEALARDMDSRFRFREIVVVAEESRKDAYLQLVWRVDNLRLLIVRDGTAFYRRREIAADEAIGDVVLLAKASELPFVDPVGMIERAADDQRAVLAIRAIGMVDRMLAAPLVGLGRMAGFKVGLRDLQTLAVPRVNAGVNLQRLAGVKVQHGRRQEGPRYRGPSCLTRVFLDCGARRVFDGGLGLGTACPAPGLGEAEAVAIHFEDMDVMGEAVEECAGHPALAINHLHLGQPHQVTRMVDALSGTLAGDLVVFAQERRQLQCLQMVGEQDLRGVGHAASPANSSMYGFGCF